MAKKRPAHLQPVDNDGNPPPEPEIDPSHPFLPGVEPDEEGGETTENGVRRYDPREFIWPASDEKGDSRKIWVRVPPMLEHQVNVIIASKKFPYTFSSDLVRHALVRHVAWLLRMETGIQSYVQQLDVLGQILGHVEQQQRFTEVADRADRVISDLVAEGTDGRKEAIKIVNSLLAQLNLMEDGYWKDKTRERILRKHSGLMDFPAGELDELDITKTED